MAANVFFIARETGWTENEILNLPKERLNSYIEILNESYKKE